MIIGAGGIMVIWRMSTRHREVAGSTPSVALSRYNAGQVVHARASVTKQLGTGQKAVMFHGWEGNRGPGGK